METLISRCAGRARMRACVRVGAGVRPPLRAGVRAGVRTDRVCRRARARGCAGESVGVHVWGAGA
eukprot:1921686-Prymnesium_polylepis.1